MHRKIDRYMQIFNVYGWRYARPAAGAHVAREPLLCSHLFCDHAYLAGEEFYIVEHHT